MTGRDIIADNERTGTAGSLESIGRVFGELAHDLAGELVVLQGWAQLARGEIEAGRPSTAELDRVLELAESLGAMLRDLLTVAEGRGLSPELDFSPLAVTGTAIAQRVRQLSSLTVRLRTELPPTTRLRGYASFWSRIVANLLSNAARHATSQVLVTLDADGAEIVLRVEDDGPGIAPEIAGQVFQPLWSGGSGGIGLGLSSAAWLVERLNGTIAVVEPRELRGAAFEVRVRPARSIAARAGTDVRAALGGRRILLVDDDAAVRSALRRLLSRLGAEVRELDPAHEPDDRVLESVIAALPEVVLLDLRLGHRGGLELWHRLVGQVPALALRAIFITGGAPGDADWEAAAASGQPVLGKPFTLQQLSDAIARLE